MQEVPGSVERPKRPSALHLMFDLDGTLTDSRVGVTQSIRHALRVLGHDPPAATALEWCIGPPLADSFRELIPNLSEHGLVVALDAYRERYQRLGIDETVVYPGIVDCLERLAQDGAVLLMVTTKPTVFAVEIARRFELDGYFRAVHGSELDGTRSGKPELIAHVLQVERIDRRDAVMIGDREHDVIGARANGVRACGVTWGFGSETELAAAGADLIACGPADLIALFDGWHVSRAREGVRP